MKNVALPLLAVLVLGAGGFGVMQYREAQRLRGELTEMVQDRDSLRERIRNLERGRVALAGGSEPAAVAGNDATGRAEPSEAGAQPAVAASAGGNRVRPEGGRFNAMMNSPEAQQLMAIQQRAALDGRYAALFRQLKLSPAELDTLKHLLVEKQAVVMDVMAAARSQGMGGRENREDLRVLVEATQAETDESIRVALGDAAYAQYKTYEATLPQRGLVDQLSQRLSYSSTPLADTQVEQMVQILAATSATTQAGGRNAAATTGTPFFRSGMVTAASGGVQVTDETVAQARGVLSAQQLEALQSLQQEQQAAASLREQMRVNRQNQQPGGLVPVNPGGG
jgi:hypothetical protein